MIFSLLGSGLFLIGIVLMYDLTGHLLMENMRQSLQLLIAEEQFRIPLTVAISLMTLGMAIKADFSPSISGCRTPTATLLRRRGPSFQGWYRKGISLF